MQLKSVDTSPPEAPEAERGYFQRAGDPLFGVFTPTELTPSLPFRMEGRDGEMRFFNCIVTAQVTGRGFS